MGKGSAESFPQLEWGGGWDFGESGLARFGPFPLSEWDAGHPARGWEESPFEEMSLALGVGALGVEAAGVDTPFSATLPFEA